MDWHESLGVYGATFLVCIVGGFIPIINSEVYLGAMAAMSTRAAVVPLAVAATLGQMTAKTALFMGGRGLLRLPIARSSERMNRIIARAQSWRGPIELFVFISAVAGIPPFHLVAVLGGTIKLSVPRFIVIGLTGRLIRFLVIAGGVNAAAG